MQLVGLHWSSQTSDDWQTSNNLQVPAPSPAISEQRPCRNLVVMISGFAALQVWAAVPDTTGSSLEMQHLGKKSPKQILFGGQVKFTGKNCIIASNSTL